MRVRRAEAYAIVKMALERHLVPLTDLLRVQVVDNREGVELVQAWSHIAIFYIRESAQVQDEVGASALAGEFVACPLNFPIRQSKALPSLAKARARLLVRPWEFARLAETANCHDGNCLSVTLSERQELWRGLKCLSPMMTHIVRREKIPLAPGPAGELRSEQRVY